MRTAEKLKQIREILKKPVLSLEDNQILEDFEPNDGKNLLYSFFTPIWLCDIMYQLAKKHGFDPSGKVLEPACGSGHFLKVLDNPENCVAFELDKLNYEIAKKREPKATIYNNYFETAFMEPDRFLSKFKSKTAPTWIKEYPFDLVIGNPPYGKHSGFYKKMFSNLKFMQVEHFFMYQSMLMLKPGGLMVFITTASFLRNDNKYNPAKEMLAKYADFVDAYRMPAVFKKTEVPTDILIFRRK